MIPGPDCTLCPLHEEASNFVLGAGPMPAEYMVIGEAPGAREDWMAKPFVGPSGDRLNMLLGLAQLKREDVYVTNVVKHRPPGNRTPKVAEVKACAPALIDELVGVRPKVIIAMGGTAIKYFAKKLAVTQEHGFPREVQYSTCKVCMGVVRRRKKRDVVCEACDNMLETAQLVPMIHPAYTMVYKPELWPELVQDFVSMKARLAAGVPVEHDYALVEAGHPYFDTSLPMGFDLETTSVMLEKRLQVHALDVVGYSTSHTPHTAVYSEAREIDSYTTARLEDATAVVVAHNAKFEYTQMQKHEITMRGFEDTKLAAWLLGYRDTRLKVLTRQLLGIEPITYSQATQGRDMGEMTGEEILEYGAADADHTLQLWNVLAPEMDTWGLRELYEEVEKPLIPLLVGIETQGIRVHRTDALRASSYFRGRALMSMVKARKTGLPTGLNSNSGDQFGPWLEQMGAPITERTDVKKNLKTDAKALRECISQDFMPEMLTHILDYREKMKLAGFPTQWVSLSSRDGYLHPAINQCGHYEENTDGGEKGAPPGRVSVSMPNMQQIPHHGRGKSEEYGTFGDRLRKCLGARDGYVLVAADVAQQEPRITAFLAKERRMLASFAEGVPVYAPMAATIYGRTIDKRADEAEWMTTKTFFLAKAYGCEWSKLMEIDPRMGKVQAFSANKHFDEQYPQLPFYGEKVWNFVQANGYARDYFGRVRWFPGVYSPSDQIRQATRREAINFTIQGPAATVIKMAMLKHEELVAEEGLDARLWLPVHDEIISEVKEEQVDDFLALIPEFTKNIMPIDMPMEAQVGYTLGDLVEVED